MGLRSCTAAPAEFKRDLLDRMAFWINANNAFTLRAIVDHYPIRNGWQYLDPFNNLLFFTAWTMLATCVALYLLRDFDTRWSVDAATHRRR